MKMADASAQGMALLVSVVVDLLSAQITELVSVRNKYVTIIMWVQIVLKSNQSVLCGNISVFSWGFLYLVG